MLKHEHAPSMCSWPASRSAPSALPLVVHHVELGDKSVQVTAALLDGPHQGHESHVVALSIKLWVEPGRARGGGGLHDHREAVRQRFGFSQDLVVVRQFAGLHGLDVVEDEAHTGRQHLDSAVLGQEVF